MSPNVTISQSMSPQVNKCCHMSSNATKCPQMTPNVTRCRYISWLVTKHQGRDILLHIKKNFIALQNLFNFWCTIFMDLPLFMLNWNNLNLISYVELLTREGSKFSYQGWLGQAYVDFVPHKRKALFLQVSLRDCLSII